jgi:hypothetical protein
MGRSRVRSRASGMDFDLDVDGLERTSREFKAVRQQVTRDLRAIEVRAAEETVLPAAKSRAARFKVEGEDVGQHVIVRKSAAGPYLTTNFRGMLARAAGLLERGGTVKTPIVPKNGRALADQRQPPRERPHRPPLPRPPLPAGRGRRTARRVR